MAHKITKLFKKKPAFPKVDNSTVGEVKAMFEDLNVRLTAVEKTLEELVKKAK